jgi:hypothetical protein
MNEEVGMRNSEFPPHPFTRRSRGSSMGPSPSGFHFSTFDYSAKSYGEIYLEPCPIIPNSEIQIPNSASPGAK